MIEREDYFKARDGLQRLVEERELIFAKGLEALHAWLASGAGARWLEFEDVIRRARAENLAQAMWWDREWRQERRRRGQEEQAQRDREREAQRQAVRAQTVPPALAPHTLAPPATAPASGRKPQGLARVSRRFEPTGERWVSSSALYNRGRVG